MAETIKVAARLDPHVYDELLAIAEAWGTSLTAVLQSLIECSIDAYHAEDEDPSSAARRERWERRSREIASSRLRRR